MQHRLTMTMFLLVASRTAVPANEPAIDPVPRAVKTQTVKTWDFDRETEGWIAENQCSLSLQPGQLNVQSAGNDPFFHIPVDLPGRQTVVELRVRSNVGGVGSVFWTTDQQPRRGEDKRVDFDMPGEGEWLVTSARFTAPGKLTDLRIDPGTKPGLIEIDWIKVIHEQLHPLSVSSVQQDAGTARFEITNHQDRSVSFQAADQTHELAAEQSLVITQPLAGNRPLELISLTLQCPDWPPMTRSVWAVNPDAPGPWLTKPMGNSTLSVARDGSVALIRQGTQVLATLAPLIVCDGQVPTLALEEDRSAIVLQGESVSLSLTPQGEELAIAIDSQESCEGPVVRVWGDLQQGLFAGLEYLGQGERSSSTLDIETPEHIRFAPDPLKVTMPLMAFVTDRVSAALTWDDMALQPIYATPNFFDGTNDHRMTLRGKKIRATLRLAHDPLEESIAWAVKKHGLPDLPLAPRSATQQKDICLTALHGPLRTDEGWGHCAEDRWPRRPFADVASTLWRLSGEVPSFDHYEFGGAHVPNGTIYFVTGNAQQWLDTYRQQAINFISRQQPDGSYRYQGKYARGHFEDTATGVCAFPAARLLEYAYITGDPTALSAGLKTLEYMKRFRTPRGAQVWECALHTPDQLASAYLVWAYTRGYQLTGKPEYLAQARRWALSGLPFTYLWGSYPIMCYATPPVYGATNWVAPNWMGLPVQWVGGVYAYALTILAPHEPSLDWNHVARGILVSAQQQQYPDGPHIGLLPDSFNIRHQRRQPADINPCALVSLQTALDGEVDFLSVARDKGTVVAAPFPVTIRDGEAHIDARAGIAYQVLVNGREIIDVKSNGQDIVPLPTASK